MSNQVELDSKTKQASEEVCIIPSGEEILAQLDIGSNTVKAMKEGMKRSYYRAVINWLMKYKANSDASNLEKVKGLLEAFYHLCEVENWKKAKTIFLTALNTPTGKNELYWQLGIWGNYNQQINLLNRILNKIDEETDVMCLNTLGIVNRKLGNYQQAIDI
jgi:tetratricopeptide (TPR) repeat protein